MNVIPIMVIPLVNALHIQLLNYHNNYDLVVHIQQLTKVCVMNDENTKDHKIQYFANFFKKKVIDWFAKYETAHPTGTWNQMQFTLITQFSEIQSERQAIMALHHLKQKKIQVSGRLL